jgi:hydroxyacylglutathione hydrolase
VLRFLVTPGHARHHVAIYDARSRSVFAGDTFGVSYRALDVDGREYIFPTCSPVQFDPAAAHVSIDRIAALQPESVYITHFSRVRDIPRLTVDLHRMLLAYEELARTAPTGGAEERLAYLREGMREILVNGALEHGCALRGEDLLALLALDTELNAQGIAVWLERLRAP